VALTTLVVVAAGCDGHRNPSPPVSKPPVSEPPVSKPPVSEPPVSEPPVSEPPVSEAPLPKSRWQPGRYTIKPPPQGLPDFTISSVSCPGIVRSGEAISISVSVANVGAANYGARIVVQAPGNHTGGVSGLNAGESKEATINMRLYGPNSTQRFRIIVDPDNVTPESNESNNSSQECTVRVTP
jgi:hypothetical protein